MPPAKKKTLTPQQRIQAIEIIRKYGTIKSAEEALGRAAIENERKASAIFNKHIFEALGEGKNIIGDNAVDQIRQCADGNVKMGKTQLTANIALANAYAPGFKGTTRTEGRIEHDIRIITAVPRPKYIEVESNDKSQITEGEVKEVDNEEIDDAKPKSK